MSINDRLDIISRSISIGFQPINNGDLVCEYFFLRLIYSWDGLRIGSKAVCKSDNFLKIQRHYQLSFFTEEQGCDPAFWSQADALLRLFCSNNLFDFDNFQRVFCPWMIADQVAFDASFPDKTSTGNKVGALALLLRFVNLYADFDSISSIDPQQFFDETPDLNDIWTTATGLSRQCFLSCWAAVFSHKHTSIPVKTNSVIASAIKAYREKYVPLQKLLTDFSDIKKHRSQLKKGVNHWFDLQDKIKKNPVERGVTIDETLFDLAAWTLKNEKATDVIRSAFYSSARNVSAFECGFLFDIFARSLCTDSDALIVNPSPDCILKCFSDKRFSPERTFFAVPDDTIASLYNQEFSTKNVVTFARIKELNPIRHALIMSRDWPSNNMEPLLSCLQVCQDSAQIYATLPQDMFDSAPEKWKKYLAENNCLINNVMLLPSTVTTKNANRKKVLVRLAKHSDIICQRQDIRFQLATLDNERLYFPPVCRSVSYSDFHDSGLTIRSLYYRAAPTSDVTAPQKKRDPAERYSFSKEIKLEYTIQANRKNRYAGKAYYCAVLRPGEHRKRGKRLTGIMEKGLRSHTEQGVLEGIEQLPFTPEMELTIVTDILSAYAESKDTLSLKTVWFCLRSTLQRRKKYNDSLAKKLFCGEGQELSNLCPSTAFEPEYAAAMETIFGETADDILLKYWEQLSIILDVAVQSKFLRVNPVERYIREMSVRATQAQREVRNALSKKTFTHEEEVKILNYICSDTQKPCGQRVAKRYEIDSISIATAICIYTGMEFREACALTWRDFMCTELNTYQFAITKLTALDSKTVSDSSKQDWKAFRLLPIVPELSDMLLARKNYLLAVCQLPQKELLDAPIILRFDPIGLQEKPFKLQECPPRIVAQKCKKIIDVAEIPSQILLLPDETNPLESDLSKYQGNIFRSNFKYRANHTCGLTRGEINYILGISPPDTFSRHYCDYTNDFIQFAIAHKLQRWTSTFELWCPSSSTVSAKASQWEGHDTTTYGPILGGCISVDLMLELDSSVSGGVLDLAFDSKFGYSGSVTLYQEEVE